MNEKIQLTKSGEEKRLKKMISFSEIDQNGNFIETYGYIDDEVKENQTFEERIKEMQEKIKKK